MDCDDLANAVKCRNRLVNQTTRIKGMAGIIGCLLAGSGLVFWYVASKLAGKPTIATDYVAEYNRITTPTDYDPNLNAAPHYERLFATYTPVPESLMAVARGEAWPSDMNDADRAAIERWLAANEEAIHSFKLAVQCPYWWRECRSSDGSLMDASFLDMSKCRGWAFAVVLLARREAGEGKVAEALQLTTDLHTMGIQTFGRNASLIEQLVGMAICQLSRNATLSIIARCPTDAETVNRTLQTFKAQIPPRVPKLAEGEFMFSMDWVQRVFTDDGHGNGRLLPRELHEMRKKETPISPPLSLVGAIGICLNHADRKETVEIIRKFYDLANALTVKTPWQMSNEHTTYAAQLMPLMERARSLYDGFTPVCRVIELGWRAQADAQGMVTVLAVLTYKAKEGHFPESLQQLVAAGLLPQMPMDPYNNAPLVYRIVGDDFILYSVGTDMVDNGGVPCKWEETGDHVFWPVQTSPTKPR
jgi:hypothetical protein